jgi:hypothetical protein
VQFDKLSVYISNVALLLALQYIKVTQKYSEAEARMLVMLNAKNPSLEEVHRILVKISSEEFSYKALEQRIHLESDLFEGARKE